jgi:DNA polymerase-3 subunit beta
MKLRCERDILRDALGIVSRAATSTLAGGAHLFACVQFVLEGDRVQLTALDPERTVRVEAEVLGMANGTCLLPATLITEIVRSLDPGAVTIDVDEEGARISAGRSQFAVRTYPSDEFPVIPAVQGEALSIDGRELAEALRQVVRAAARGENRPSLTAVHLEATERGLRLEATDSYRLARRDLVGRTVLKEGQQVLVPARSFEELQRLLSSSAGVAVRPGPAQGEGGTGRCVTLRVSESHATFEVGSVLLMTQLVNQAFPNTERLFPKSYPNRLVVGKDPLLDGLRRMRLFAQEDSSAVSLTLGAEGLQLRSTDPERGQASEEIDAKYEGSDLKIGFNPRYLMEGVEGVQGDEVLIEMSEPTRAATVSGGEGDPYRYLIMPIIARHV